MKKFLILFTCAENSKNHQAWKNLGSHEQKERILQGTVASENWEEKFGDKIIFQGSSVGERTLTVDSNGIQESPSRIGKYIVIEASSQEEAAKIFLEHPHFSFFPGDSVEVLEIVDSRG